MGWLTANQFAQYLRSQGFPINADDPGLLAYIGERFGDILDDACLDFQRRTGYTPFIVASDADGPVRTTRTLTSVTNGILDLKGGIVGMPSVISYVNPDGTQRTPITLHPYQAIPTNALDEGKPITSLMLTGGTDWTRAAQQPDYPFTITQTLPYPLYGGQIVEVTAYWGAYLTVPKDVLNSVLGYASIEVLDAYEVSQMLNRGGLESWTEAGVTEKYKQMMFGASQDVKQAKYKRCWQGYRRLKI